MDERREQEKPFAHKRSPSEADFITRRRHRCLKCCGCSAALLLLLAVAILVLTITVFHVKDPSLDLNSVTINNLESLSNNTTNNYKNITLAADISIKNPNAASFKFEEAATEVYYGGGVVGEARAAAGDVGPRRTRRMSVVAEVMVDRVVGVSRFESDLVEGSLGIRTSTRVKGVVKIGGVVKRSFLVEINCTMSVNFRTHVVQDVNCKRDASF